MIFKDTKRGVGNRGVPPDAFLAELVTWGAGADEAIFAPNEHDDTYTDVVGILGPWRGLGHRRAVMLEVLRVLAGFESSWHWAAGADPTNPASNRPDTMEAGAWQVSADSMAFGPELRELVRSKVGDLDGTRFQEAMKRDHVLAMEYVARLLRRTIRAHGPLLRHEVDAWLSPDAVDEFQKLMGV